MKATELLHRDHEQVDKLLDQLMSGNTGGRTRGDVANEIIRELSIHAAIEEAVFYPVCREALPDKEFDVLEDLEEHHVVKVLLSELDGMDPDDERFLPKANVLAENVRHHVEEEESELFPAIEGALAGEDLEDLGERLERAKGVAPTRPHPSAPDEGAGTLANIGAAAIDRLRDRLARR